MSADFILSAIQTGALWVSATQTRTLKSGRESPYFFDSSRFHSGRSLRGLAMGYALALRQYPEITYDCLFGPAYKGITLAAATAMAVNELQGRDVQFSSNRKEAKTHGEGGSVLGADLAGKRVVMVDDVLTRGDAKREGRDFILAHGGTLVAVLIAFDREERGESGRSAAQELAEEFGVPVIAAAGLRELIVYFLMSQAEPETLAALQCYHQQYGVHPFGRNT